MSSSTSAERNADYIRAVAQGMLAADFPDIAMSRVTQFAIGWMRAAFDQSLVIATLASEGLARAASPNRRCHAEIVTRLHWLYSTGREDRAAALDALLEYERESTEKTVGHLSDMGFVSQLDLSDMRDFALEPASGGLKNEARQFLAAAKSTVSSSAGFYYAWREETQYTHATGAMAAAYAPEADDDEAHPPIVDPDLRLHTQALFVVVGLTYHLLVEEGVSLTAAGNIINTFLRSSA